MSISSYGMWCCVTGGLVSDILRQQIRLTFKVYKDIMTFEDETTVLFKGFKDFMTFEVETTVLFKG